LDEFAAVELGKSGVLNVFDRIVEIDEAGVIAVRPTCFYVEPPIWILPIPDVATNPELELANRLKSLVVADGSLAGLRMGGGVVLSPVNTDPCFDCW
jgi:hypothetical protein